jgi:hypothetical protein
MGANRVSFKQNPAQNIPAGANEFATAHYIALSFVSDFNSPSDERYLSATRRQYSRMKGELALLANSKNSSAAFNSRANVLDGSIISGPPFQDIQHHTSTKEKRPLR